MEKLVPKLRFPEFEGNWERKTIKDIANKITDGTHYTPKPIEKGVPFLTAIHVRDGFIDYENCYFLTEEEHKKIYDRCNPEKGDLLMVNIGSGTATSALVEVDFQFSLKNVALIKPDINKIFPDFFAQVQRKNSSRLKHQISAGGAQPFLSLKEIAKLKLNIPSLPEQQKIASFLTSVDERLTLLAQQKEKLELYKKGVMQQIFPSTSSGQAPKLRFKDENGENYPDWEEKKLGDIAKITTGSSNRQDSGLDGKYTFFDRSEDIRTSNIYLFDSEAIIVAGEGSDFVPKYFEGKFDLHQRTYAILDFKQSNGKFLFYYIHFFRNYFLSQAVGSTVKSLRLPMFQKMKIDLPCLEEQQKIASFLSAIDVQIEGVSNKIEQTKLFKKGLLQQMFV